MSSQAERAKSFHNLHIKGKPLVLFNIWDPGSARAVAEAGAKALATGSWAVAAAHGYDDGEDLPVELVIANLRRIVAAVEIPVTVDLETGYGATAEAVSQTVTQAISAGAIGCNLEDQIIGEGKLYPIPDQASRLRAARGAADKLGVPVFINARTDVFFIGDQARHDASLLGAALERAEAYARAGASGLFVPGLVDEHLIEELCRSCPLPVNILARPNTPPFARLAELGVARISHGGASYRLVMQVLTEAARKAQAAAVR